MHPQLAVDPHLDPAEEVALVDVGIAERILPPHNPPAEVGLPGGGMLQRIGVLVHDVLVAQVDPWVVAVVVAPAGRAIRIPGTVVPQLPATLDGHQAGRVYPGERQHAPAQVGEAVHMPQRRGDAGDIAVCVVGVLPLEALRVLSASDVVRGVIELEVAHRAQRGGDLAGDDALGLVLEGIAGGIGDGRPHLGAVDVELRVGERCAAALRIRAGLHLARPAVGDGIDGRVVRPHGEGGHIALGVLNGRETGDVAVEHVGEVRRFPRAIGDALQDLAGVLEGRGGVGRVAVIDPGDAPLTVAGHGEAAPEVVGDGDLAVGIRVPVPARAAALVDGLDAALGVEDHRAAGASLRSPPSADQRDQ